MHYRPRVIHPPPVHYAPPPQIVYVPAPPPAIVYAPPVAADGSPGAQVTRDGYDSAGHYCREYVLSVQIGGRVQQGYGIACLMPDGSWRIVQ